MHENLEERSGGVIQFGEIDPDNTTLSDDGYGTYVLTSDITGEVLESNRENTFLPAYTSVSGVNYEVDFDKTVTIFDHNRENGIDHETEYKDGELVRDREIVHDPEDDVHSIITEQEGDRTTVTTRKYDTDDNGKLFVYTDSREVSENGKSLYSEKNIDHEYEQKVGSDGYLDGYTVTDTFERTYTDEDTPSNIVVETRDVDYLNGGGESVTTERTVCANDEDRTPVERTMNYVDREDEIRGNVSYQFDESGNCVKETGHESDGYSNNVSWDKEYDSEGNEIEQDNNTDENDMINILNDDEITETLGEKTDAEEPTDPDANLDQNEKFENDESENEFSNDMDSADQDELDESQDDLEEEEDDDSWDPNDSVD